MNDNNLLEFVTRMDKAEIENFVLDDNKDAIADALRLTTKALAAKDAEIAALKEALRDVVSSMDAVLAYAEPHRGTDYIVPAPIKRDADTRRDIARALLAKSNTLSA